MKRLLPPLLLTITIVLTGCAGNGAIAKVAEPVHEACELYEKLLPKVVLWRTWAVENWAIIPDDQRKLLEEVDQELPGLDRLGRRICLVSDGLEVIDTGTRVDWDRALDVALRAAAAYYRVRSETAPR